MQPTKHSKAGFSLTELLIATGIGLMVMTGVLSLLLTMSKTLNTAIREANSTQENMSIRRRLESDLRGTSLVISKSDSKFHFVTTDLNGNAKEIYYKIENRDSEIAFIRNEVSGSNQEEVFLSQSADGLAAVELTYYNQMGGIASSPADANAIKIDIARKITGTRNSINRDLQITLIMFRNKMYDI